ncbi:hypothetical protein OC861_001341 [Tilletia horrida]|nr:hypothetical protein OC861_001341 [Tilletia horrida]
MASHRTRAARPYFLLAGRRDGTEKSGPWLRLYRTIDGGTATPRSTQSGRKDWQSNRKPLQVRLHPHPLPPQDWVALHASSDRVSLAPDRKPGQEEWESLGGYIQPLARAIGEWLQREALRCYPKELKRVHDLTWDGNSTIERNGASSRLPMPSVVRLQVPKQTDGCNCGVHVIQFFASFVHEPEKYLRLAEKEEIAMCSSDFNQDKFQGVVDAVWNLAPAADFRKHMFNIMSSVAHPSSSGA